MFELEPKNVSSSVAAADDDDLLQYCSSICTGLTCLGRIPP